MPVYSIQTELHHGNSFQLKKSSPDIHLTDSLNTHLSSVAFTVGAKHAVCQHSSNSGLQCERREGKG